MEACFARLDGLESFLRPGSTVLLKPNLLSSTAPPEKAINTHPFVVRAVAEILLGDFKCKIIIGDSCGSMAPNSTNMAIENSGIDQICSQLGAQYLNFDKCEHVALEPERSRVLREFKVAKPVLEADVVVSLPKMKTHGLTTLTGAV